MDLLLTTAMYISIAITAFSAGFLFSMLVRLNAHHVVARRSIFDKPLSEELEKTMRDAGVLESSFYDFDFWTIEAMKKEGGSFVKALAAAAIRADAHNLERIKRTWPEYWGDYEEIGQRMRFEACSEGICDGSGKVVTDADDGEGHMMKGVDEKKCLCRVK